MLFAWHEIETTTLEFSGAWCTDIHLDKIKGGPYEIYVINQYQQ